jgi:hypothetical protein
MYVSDDNQPPGMNPGISDKDTRKLYTNYVCMLYSDTTSISHELMLWKQSPVKLIMWIFIVMDFVFHATDFQ